MPPDFCAPITRDSRVDAYLFDLDGTLLDTEVLWVEATATLLREMGKTVADEQASAWVHGRAWHDIYADIAAAWPDLAIGVESLDARLRPYYNGLRETRDVLIHSSVTLLRTLAGHTPVVIVSGSPRSAIAEAVAQMGVGDDIAFYLGSDDYRPGKPHPACFLAAASRLGVKPGRCVVFEDSSAGIQAARQAGMAVVALARPTAPPQHVAPADWVVADLSEYTPQRLYAARAARETRH